MFSNTIIRVFHACRVHINIIIWLLSRVTICIIFHLFGFERVTLHSGVWRPVTSPAAWFACVNNNNNNNNNNTLCTHYTHGFTICRASLALSERIPHCNGEVNEHYCIGKLIFLMTYHRPLTLTQYTPYCPLLICHVNKVLITIHSYPYSN